MATLGRVWRTVRPLSREQLGGRLLHELRLRGAWRIPGLLATQLRGERNEVAPGTLPVLPPSHPGAELRTRHYLETGQVRAAGHVVAADAWNDPGLPKLVRYHLHYLEVVRDLVAVGGARERDAALELVSRWRREHPLRSAEAWEPYPVASRLQNLVAAAASGQSTLPEWMSELISTHARYLEKWPETHLQANHLLKDWIALAMAGLVLDGPDSARWRSIGLRQTEHELTKQVLADGGHYERSPMYHLLVLSDLLDLRDLCSARAQAPEWLLSAVSRMAALAVELRHPDGEVPLFNDAVIGQAPPPSWVLQRAGIPEDSPPARVFDAPDYGLTVVRPSAGEALFFDTGALGPEAQPGHAHSDTLSYELAVSGVRAIVNGGMDGYQSANRAFLRSAAAHNTVTVAGEGPDELWGSFRVGARCRITRRSVDDLDGAVRLQGALRSHQGWEHLRTLLLIPGTGLVVLDRVRGAGGAEVVSRARIVPGSGVKFFPILGTEHRRRAPYAPGFGEVGTIDEHSVCSRGDEVQLAYLVAWSDVVAHVRSGNQLTLHLEGQCETISAEMW